MNIDIVKTRLADSAAISDIECTCDRTMICGTYWYDTSHPLQHIPYAPLEEAVFYLESRGLIEHHTEHTAWARFTRIDTPSQRTPSAEVTQ